MNQLDDVSFDEIPFLNEDNNNNENLNEEDKGMDDNKIEEIDDNSNDLDDNIKKLKIDDIKISENENNNDENDDIDIDEIQRQGDELSLAFRPIKKIPKKIAKRDGQYVKTLNLTECGIRSYENIEYFTNLETLILDKNNLKSVGGCPRINTLTTLWVNNNNIQDLPNLMDQINILFPNILYLSMMRNPCAPGLMDIIQPDLESIRLYRLYVIYRIPRLLCLDSTDITNRERNEGNLRGQFAVKRKPKNRRTSFNKIDNDEILSATHSTKPSSKIAIHKDRYDGRHSEGNRFITDSLL